MISNYSEKFEECPDCGNDDLAGSFKYDMQSCDVCGWGALKPKLPANSMGLLRLAGIFERSGYEKIALYIRDAADSLTALGELRQLRESLDLHKARLVDFQDMREAAVEECDSYATQAERYQYLRACGSAEFLAIAQQFGQLATAPGPTNDELFDVLVKRSQEAHHG